MVRLSSWGCAAVLLSAAVSSGADREPVTAADCTFIGHRDEFLGRAARDRRDIYDRVRRAMRGQALAAPVAADSLPQRNFIDQEIFGKLIKTAAPAAPLTSDEEFVRRIYLDLTGRIPSSDDVRAFVADSSTAKRDALIDQLLNSPEFNDRWTMWLGDLLGNTSKLANAAINRNAQGRTAFYQYIRDAVAGDKPLRQVAIDVITATGNNYDAGSGAANYAMGASTSMGPVQDTYDTMLVRTTTAFLGMGNYDCLLCHNGRGHLDQVNLWASQQTRMQAEGMAAFFSRLMFSNSAPQGSFNVADAGSGAYELNTDSGNRPPRNPIGTSPFLYPTYRGSMEPITGDDWRGTFAANLVQDSMFARNLANRLWKQMFGQPLADPVDGLDPARLDPTQPPPDPWTLQASHPALLEKLAGELAAGDFRLRGFLRTLAQSSAYQLGSRVSGDWNEGAVPLFARHYARRMEAEEVHDAIAKATGVPGSYAINGLPGRVQWAMQLPEPVEPAGDAGVNNFLNTFLRGNRDTLDRSQSGSIQQELALMNDNFVISRVKARSPGLAAIAQIASNEDAVEELYLTFLSRRPTGAEKAAGAAVLAQAGGARNAAIEDMAWACVNKVEFLYSY
jgi:uncharacterized protein DUF1549/uncharacterized protein DUF1553